MIVGTQRTIAQRELRGGCDIDADSALDLSLPTLAESLRSGELDVTAVAEAALDRLEAREPSLFAFVPEPGRRERVLSAARELAGRFPAPSVRPPLFGTPVAIKDVIRVEGLPTRAGSALPESAFAGPEAPVVRRLCEAGALVLGKSVTTEFAYFEPAATRNPRAPGRTPGGSSSGSAAAVAAGIVPLALGTQTVGSVIRPAAYCGVAAFTPSAGRVSNEGVVHYSPSVDTIGWFAVEVAGLVEVARVILEGAPSPGLPSTVRLGVPVGPYLEQAEPEALRAFDSTLARLEAGGVGVVRVPALEDIGALAERHQWLIAHEFHEQHRERHRLYGSLYRPRSSLLFEEGAAVTSNQYATGLRSAGELRARLEAAMAGAGLDAWVCPSAPGVAPAGLTSTGSPAMNLPWTHAGLPVVTLPAGLLEGCPLGLQLVGRHGGDEALLDLARRVEVLLRP
ncbi:MAG: amidase [Dehalococcoidia bacterium]|nr:amidase [Dehalococcoidia bacterium]